MAAKVRSKPAAAAAQVINRISVITFLFAVFVILATTVNLIETCQRVYFGSRDKLACQCNATHCDSLQFEWPKHAHRYVRVTSSKAGARFEVSEHQEPADDQMNDEEADYAVRVEVNKRRQQVLGFGGAFTDSASQNIGSLEERVQSKALDDYFGARGLAYNLGRLPIAGTDMSTRAYSYDDMSSGDEQQQQLDLELRHFKLQPEDLIYKIPLIRRINRLREEPLRLVAASWSAPAWMKSNRHLVQGRLRGNSSGAPFYDAYARYVVRFLDEYERRNISMWALSPQNEPHTPKRTGPKTINFNSNNFEPEEMADYLEHSLIPALERSGRTKEQLALLLWDDTTDGLDKYQQAALQSPVISQRLAGLALHWYSQGLRETPYEDLHAVRRQLPSQYFMLSTEASFIGRPQPGNWERGQRYARDILEHLNAGSVAWIDWNLALNTSGGPTWSANILDSSMLVDVERQLYYKNPMYYAIGHVSRFIRPGSHILRTTIRPLSARQQLPVNVTLAAAELEPELIKSGANGEAQLERRVALVALNRAPQECSIRLELIECKAKSVDERKPLVLRLAANSITSLAFVC